MMPASNGKFDVAPNPLRVMFLHTMAQVGGAETLMVNLIRRLDRSRFAPELCCLKIAGSLGEVLAEEIPAFEGLLRSKYDLRVLPRLARLLRRRRIDAIVSVGGGRQNVLGTTGRADRRRVDRHLRDPLHRLAGPHRAIESRPDAV